MPDVRSGRPRLPRRGHLRRGCLRHPGSHRVASSSSPHGPDRHPLWVPSSSFASRYVVHVIPVAASEQCEGQAGINRSSPNPTSPSSRAERGTTSHTTLLAWQFSVPVIPAAASSSRIEQLHRSEAAGRAEEVARLLDSLTCTVVSGTAVLARTCSCLLQHPWIANAAARMRFTDGDLRHRGWRQIPDHAETLRLPVEPDVSDRGQTARRTHDRIKWTDTD